jgi:hypothetical protein
VREKVQFKIILKYKFPSSGRKTTEYLKINITDTGNTIFFEKKKSFFLRNLCGAHCGIK